MTPNCHSKESVRLPMRDAQVYYWPRIDVGRHDGESLLEELISSIWWKQETVLLWGKRVLQPRLTAWYGDPGACYAYSGLQLNPSSWNPLLAGIRDKIEPVAGSHFNSVLANYYRDDRDSMGMHSDDEPELGHTPIIASFSVGQERKLVFRHKSKVEKTVSLILASNSLLLMKGETQRYWKHGIVKASHPCGPRVNLTFRYVVS